MYCLDADVAPLHIELTASPDLPIAENTLRRLKQANSDFDAWERYWDRILCELETCPSSTKLNPG